ncbi:T9SS type A sorting domain-containing protein [Polaribacter sp. Asnod1-A03]|uniref:T9SS type A sorting domain-containing protein n=1 Tax=Polaribacter sp. Asnod1-A03 TaxID=3160581 RepID=UPI00386D2C01
MTESTFKFLFSFIKFSLLILLLLNSLTSNGQSTITTIYGDNGGFTVSSTSSRINYNDSNNLLGFTVDGVTYSTGVNDPILTSNNITFIEGDFFAFPIPANISYNTSELVGIGSYWGGVLQNNSSTDYIKNFDPIVPSSFVRDGNNGLELTTNFFNIKSQTITYDALVINQSQTINDDMPDIIATQTGAPGATDTFKFIDSDGDIVGNAVKVEFGGVDIVGGTYWTIYRIDSSDGTIQNLFATNSQRDLRLISFKLSDFGITNSNFTDVNNFVHITSGNTDIAFTAFNSEALEIDLPAVDLEVTSSNITADDFCNPTNASFTTTITNNSINLSKDFDVNLDITGVTVDSSSSSFTASNSSIFSASYNELENKWIISELQAGESVTLTVNTSINSFDYPIGFTTTVNNLFQPDSDLTNNALTISEYGEDYDCDGIKDEDDLDDDNDGILDSVEGTLDDDNDGISNYLDLDSDGDGCPDALEGGGTVGESDLDGDFKIIGNVNDDGIPTLAEAGAGSGQSIGDSQDVNIKACDTTDTDLDGIIDLVDLDDDNDGILDIVEGTDDTDNDGVINSLDADSDGDGCPDALEGSANFTLSDVDVNNRLTGEVDEYGIPLLAEEGQEIGDSQDNAVQDANCSLLPVIISQIYQTTNGNAIELTNIGTSTVSNIRLSMFKDTASPTGVLPTASIVVSTLEAGSSVVIKSEETLSGVTLVNSPLEVINADVTDLSDGDDIIILSTTTDTFAWENRYDVVSDIDNTTSLVRIDERTQANTTYTSSEWISFIDDSIPVLGDSNPIPSIIRHANSPLISEVRNPDFDANNGLGLHRINPTIRTISGWSNGFPDKSRSVIIDDSYVHSDGSLKARVLNVKGDNILSIENNALIVLNSININIDAQIRIIGTGQFIQVHEDETQVTGSGKLLISQKSEHTNVYRYNYWSSPVLEFVGANTYSVSSVMKDTSGDLTINSTIADIDFIEGYDGAPGTPIQIASYWIWTYFNGFTRDDWLQVKESYDITKGLGYIMKSTGVNPQYFTFSGSPIDGDVSLNIAGNTSSLVGNPYPGTLDGNAFILGNEGTIDGTLYFWEHSGEESTDLGHWRYGYEGGYAQLTFNMGVAANSVIEGTSGLTESYTYTTPSRYIAVGQGFYISSDSDGGSLHFKNIQRGYQETEPYFFKGENKTTISLPILKLGMDFTNENYIKIHRQIGISFKENHSFDFDYGYESEMIDIGSTDMYWDFEEINDKKLVIAGIEDIKEDLQIPITILVDSDEPIFVRIDEQENISNNIYLLDILEGNTQQLKTDDIVKLELSKGVYQNRFFIVFKESKSLSINDENIDSNLNVFMDDKSNEISIINSDNLLIEDVGVFNILGQNIKTWNLNISDSEILLDANQLSTSVYIIKVKTSKGIITSKVLKN